MKNGLGCLMNLLVETWIKYPVLFGVLWGIWKLLERVYLSMQ